MSSGTGNLGENTPGAGSNLKPYLKRKKSSLGETKIAVLGADGVGKSGKYFLLLRYVKLLIILSCSCRFCNIHFFFINYKSTQNCLFFRLCF